MLRVLDVALEIGRGLGLVRSTSFVEELEGLIFRYASTLLAVMLKILQYMFAALALLTVATTIYAVAYQLIMPTKLHEKDVFFDYGPSECEGICSPLPHTTVDFLSKHDQWIATPLAKLEPPVDRILIADRFYVVDVEMHVPESGVNSYMGNWMVQVDVMTKDEQLLGRSARPLILTYRSRIVRLLRTFVMAPLIAFGFASESQRVRVTCFDRFQESGEYPLAKARVSISTRNLQLYSATLSITAQLNWLQHIMHEYFWITAFFSIVCLASIEAACLGFLYVWTQLSREESQVEAGDELLQGQQVHQSVANDETGVVYSGGGMAMVQVEARDQQEGTTNGSGSVVLIGTDTEGRDPPVMPAATTIPAYQPATAGQQQIRRRHPPHGINEDDDEELLGASS